jgi:hypothetical protein
MRGAKKPGPLFMAAFAILLLMVTPHAARAQQTQPFDVNGCITTMQNAQMKGAQDRLAIISNVISNTTIPHADFTCIQNILNFMPVLGGITNPFALFWKAVLAVIIQPLITQVCALVTSAINAAVSFAKSLLCIPLPGLEGIHLTMPNFGAGRCNGISLLPNLGVTQGSLTPPAGQWSYGNYQPQ